MSKSFAELLQVTAAPKKNPTDHRAIADAHYHVANLVKNEMKKQLKRGSKASDPDYGTLAKIYDHHKSLYMKHSYKVTPKDVLK